ncbi:mechanosensitive ion channel family protein [Microseira sp. BLCC-F43]|jgi:small conductance mechanosensitive channel|uniref:mechanosensitive ion channel family protein n=1 Tax=Microseira sp. BLCC-F43 TaxID=3153602 RepID=UPI0035BA9D09
MKVDIVITVAEVVLLMGAFFLLNWLVGIAIKQMTKFSWIRGKTDKIATWRRNISRLLLFTCGALCILVVGVNGIVIYQRQSVQEFQLKLLNSIPPQFWLTVAASILQTISLLVLVKISLPVLHRGVDWACERAQNFDNIPENDQSIGLVFRKLKNLLTNSIWLLSFTLCSQFIQLPQIVTNCLLIGLKIYINISIGLLCVKAIDVLIDTLDAISSKKDNQKILGFYQRFHHLVPLSKKYMEYVIYLQMADLIVGEFNLLAKMAEYIPKIIHIVTILFLSAIVIEIANYLLEDLILRAEKLTELQKQRRQTIIPLIKSILKYLIYFTAGILSLNVINIDPGPILAGAGIVGIAIGLGAQNLINDIVCGFFILFDNYYLVGDYIEVNAASGFVEAIDLRSTRIRNMNGQVHIIRNGEIKDIINYSKQYIYAVVEVSVTYECNLDHLYQVLEEAGKQLKENYPEIIEPMQVDGIEKFGESDLSIRTITKVKPGSHTRIQRITRKIIKDTLDREGIEISSGDQVMILKHDSLNHSNIGQS